jgi:hypothetical protein
MIRLTTDNGVEVHIETIHNPKKVDNILTNCLQPDAYNDFKRKVIEYEEIFFQFTAGRRVDLPMLRHHLVHLDKRSQDPNNLMIGNWIIITHVHQDHLDEAITLAKRFTSAVKNTNNWEETTRFAVTDNIFTLPIVTPDDYE